MMECHVYQIVSNMGFESLGVRSHPSVDPCFRTSVTFKPGELVCVDTIKAAYPKQKEAAGNSSPPLKPKIKNGPFLRLADSSGWLFEHFNERPVMKPVPVQIGIWAFFVGNAPYGLSLRSHPVDRTEFRVRKDDDDDDDDDGGGGGSNDLYICYAPSQRVFCDRKVTHPDTGVNFYRVQGTNDWVFDRRPGTMEGEDDIHMLLEENLVKTGLFAYQCLPDVDVDIGIRAWPCTAFLTGEAISPGDIVAVDMVQESPYPHGNGPFIRLADCSGWLFVKKKETHLMEEVKVTPGTWTFMVVNPEGAWSLRHPTDNALMRLKTGFPQNELLECDQRVTSTKGVNYYRVADTNVWIGDKRDGVPQLEALSEGPPSSKLQNGGPVAASWSPEFVRGIAFGVDGLKEKKFSPPSRLITFRHINGVDIHVYYSTRTVITALDSKEEGKTQLFRRNCSPLRLREIFMNPFRQNDEDYQRKEKLIANKPPVEHPALGAGFLVEEEEELRNDLYLIEKQIQQLCQQRSEVMKEVKPYDILRWEQSKKDQQIAEKKVNTFDTACEITDL